MEVASQALDTDVTVKIEKPVAGFLLEYRKTTTPDGLEEFANELGMLANQTIDVKMRGRDGSPEHVMPQLPLWAIIEGEAFNEEQINVLQEGADIVVRAYLPFSESGAIPFNNDEVLEASISALTLGGASWNLTVYAIDHKLVAENFKKYDLLNMPQGQRAKDFDLQDVENIVIKISDITASTELDFKYTNGKNIPFKLAELKAQAILANEVVVNYNGMVVSGYNNYLVLNVEDVDTLTITRNSTSAFDILIEKEYVHKELAKAVKINKKLVRTSLPRLQNFVHRFVKNPL